MLLFFRNRITVLLLIMILFGAFLRFYNLNWGSPYYFHPDERNIASSVSQLQFPGNMNPHFFAYGSLPIYTIFFTGLPLALTSYCEELASCRIRFEDAIIIGRAYSALFSLLLIPFSFVIGKKLHSKRVGLLTAVLVTFSTGLIQYAHFATFELWTTFFSALLLLFSMKLVSSPEKKGLLAASFASGVLISVKMTNAFLLPIPFVALGIGLFKNRNRAGKKLHLAARFFLSSFFVLLITCLVFLISNPFVFLASDDFLGSMRYESGVALGTLPVFYTGEFYQTLPLFFQFYKVFPFLLNPLLTFLGVISFFYGLFLLIKKGSPLLLLLILVLSALLFPQAFFFVKWTRYMVPTIPFFILLISLFLVTISEQKMLRFPANLLILICIVATTLFGFSYFITAFVEKDTRVLAALEAKKILPVSAPILSEVYDMGIVAFNEHFPRIILFNFYDLDQESTEFNTEALHMKLAEYDYLILPSQRVMATRIGHPQTFPEGFAFYTSLEQNKQQFQKVYETPCSIFCMITYLGDQVFRFEGTANTFDRPPLQVYKIIHEK